jgi:hypothetical protein
MSKVNGTANLFKVTTASWNGFDAWHIANNAGWDGTNNSVYRTYTNNDQYSITNAVRFEGAPVPSTGWTVIPGNDHSTGGDPINNNCEFYSFTTVPGMWTHNVSITPPTYGTLTINYVDVSGSAQAFSSGNRDLAHTCIITVTAVPGMGYADPAVIYINGVAHGNRDPFVLTEDAVVSALFEPAVYTVTLNTNGGTINSGNVTSYTYGVGATLPTDVTKSGSYIFAGWYDNAGCTGSAVTEISTTDTGNKTYWAKWDAVTIVDIPGTVNKGNVYTYSADMTWYGANNEYFNIGDGDHPNLDRWVEWVVNLTLQGNYIVTEEYSCPNGHRVLLELLDAGRNVVASYETPRTENFEGETTYATMWDLNSVPTGVYTLRLRNVYNHSQPKEKSFTFTHAGLSVTYTKVPNQTLYGRDGDASRAYGEIGEPTTVTTSGIAIGASVDSTGNVLTIGDVTIVAPDSVRGILYNIPATGGGVVPPSGCDWRFRCWRNLPATITGDISNIEAVYYPTFNVDYNTNGGTINDPKPYTTWYEYTGLEADQVSLPQDVTKPGYMFAGWYQQSTTQLFMYLTCNYYGDYSKGASCHSDDCDYRLKAHWVLPCDEPQTISKVTITGSGTSNYTYEGYNNKEYAGTPVVSVGSYSATFDGKIGYQLQAANDIVFATIKTGTTFRVGDHIYVYITEKNTTRTLDGGSNTNLLTLYYGTGAGDAHVLVNLKIPPQTTPEEWRGVYSYTLDADDVLEMTEAGATGVGVWRDATNGENPCIYSVEITGCRDLIFDNNDGDHLWSNPANWAPTYTEIPSYYQATRIIQPCTVDIADAHAKVVKLCTDLAGHEGRLTINANAALEVTQQISEVHGIDYNTLYDVAPENIIVKSNASNQGALAHGYDGSFATHATIEQYARGSGYLGGGNPTWQYVGVPFSDVNNAMEHYYGSEMCRWIENTTGNAGTNWSYVAKTGEQVVPFQGYALTNPSAKTFTNQGTLVSSTDQTLTLTCAGTTGYTGWNMFANSWMAPINIEKFEDADFGDNVQKTVYLMNTGINNGQQADFPNYESSTGSAGQYVAVPIHTAAVMGSNKFIAPMQGFYLVTEAASTVTLRYDLVRNSEHTALSVLPNRAPRYAEQSEAELMPRLRIDVTGSRFADRLYVLENTNQTNAFDNGWDGYKIEGEDYAPQLMTRTGDLDLAVDVSPAFDGKQIAFRAGEDTEYTLHFSTTENGLVLRDLVTDVVTPIEDGGTYHFFASNRESAIRFVIGDNRQVPTGFDEQSVLTSDQIFSLSVYTADGRLVLRRTSDFDDPLLLPQSGVYIFYMQTTEGVKIQKITF